jgi:putative nucleotidyltransferase with HDIG domain
MMTNSDEIKEWRKAAKKVMRKATIKEAQQRSGRAQPVYNYRWEHVKAVATLAIKLAKLTGADEEIVEAAAWLHDIAKDKGSDHPQIGANYARRFLPKTTFPVEKIERVAQAIEQHMGLWRSEPLQELEAQVLWDADKLAKIGLTAAFHWTGMVLAEDTPKSTADLIGHGRKASWQEKTVASMHTTPAKRAAEARLHAYNQLWNELEAELRGDDLGQEEDD